MTTNVSAVQTLVNLKNVSVSLGGNRVLQDISLQISPGELVGILGPNGAGKTTLIRAILGLLPLDSGEISGVVLTDKNRAQIGYVPQKQDARWEYPITVEEVVISSLRPWILATSAQWRAAFAALEAVGMKEFRSRPISALSGGQRQRVLIARALAPKPKLLLLDEPFTGLDEPNQEALSELITSLRAGGISIMMSTHDLVQAANMCDRFILINKKIIADGSLTELHSPQLWAETYEVSTDSALMRAVSVLTEAC